MIYRSDSLRMALIALIGVAIPSLVQANDGQSNATEPGVDEALLARAMDASPEDLGVSFLVNRYMIKLTELVGGNLQIHTPEGTIDEKSATKRRVEFDKRLRAYRHAITQRGFQDLSGEYKLASIEPSCAKVGSLLMGGAQEGIFEQYEIMQDAFELTLSLTVEGEPGQNIDIGTFDFTGVVVESSLVLEDPMNSDYFLDGRLRAGRIEIKPRLDVLNGWPKWAGPPKRRDMENCRLVLERVESE